jgi:hypothetical protein
MVVLVPEPVAVCGAEHEESLVAIRRLKPRIAELPLAQFTVTVCEPEPEETTPFHTSAEPLAVSF